MITTSLHNHSTWSDGTVDIATMANAAKAAGLKTFGISDHWVMLTENRPFDIGWSIHPERLERYFEECLEVKKQVETEDFTMRIGVEVDFFPENWQKNIAHLANYPLDYAIGAIHNLDGFPVDSSPKPWQALDQDAINDIWRKYYRRLKALAETRAFSIIAHFDLPKKFGFRPTIDLDSEITAALQAVRDSGAQLELNTAGWSKPCAEPYPSPSLLKRALALDIPILITADAHAPQHVNRDFDKAIELLNSLA